MNLTTLKTCWLLCFICLFVIADEVKAQDIHNSMFNRSPMNINPALTGIFAGDLRVTSNYRRQWVNVPVAYKTFTTSLEYKLFPCSKKGGFALGAYFNHDDAGDLALRTNQVGGSLSYLHAFSPKHFLSGGVQLGGSFRNFNTDNIRVDVQYDGDRYNGSLPHQETALLNNTTEGNVNFLSFSGGLNYRYQNRDKDKVKKNNKAGNKRTRVDIGVAVYHFNQPSNNFRQGRSINGGTTDGQLNRRYSVYGISSFKLLPDIDVGFLISGQFQGPYQEVMIGGNGRFYLPKKKARPTSLLFGLSYRVDDAIIPNINVDYRNFSFGFSYDINISRFDVATNNNGGPEFSVIYTMAKVCPLKEHKICPIF